MTAGFQQFKVRRSSRVRATSEAKTRLLAVCVLSFMFSSVLHFDVAAGAAARRSENDDIRQQPKAAEIDNKSPGSTAAENAHQRRQHRQNTLQMASDDVHCSGLRSKRYISDGFCRTLEPVSEMVCVGYCVPARALSNYAEFVRAYSARSSGSRQRAAAAGASRNSSEADIRSDAGSGSASGGGAGRALSHRCIDGVVRNQRVRLICDNGDTKVYRIRVVKSCACSSMDSIITSYRGSITSRHPQNRLDGRVREQQQPKEKSTSGSKASKSQSVESGQQSDSSRYRRRQEPLVNPDDVDLSSASNI